MMGVDWGGGGGGGGGCEGVRKERPSLYSTYRLL